MEKQNLKEEKGNVAEFTKLLGSETENHHQACLVGFKATVLSPRQL